MRRWHDVRAGGARPWHDVRAGGARPWHDVWLTNLRGEWLGRLLPDGLPVPKERAGKQGSTRVRGDKCHGTSVTG